MSGTLDIGFGAGMQAPGIAFGADPAAGAPAVNLSDWNQYAPGGGTWWDRNFGMNSGAGSNADLAKALKGLGGAVGGGQQQQQAGGGGGQGSAPYPASGQAGSPRRPINIAAIVEMLQKRQQDLFGSATAPGGQAQSMPAPRVMGLLGY